MVDRANYPGIPADFPIDDMGSGLSGAQLKLSLVEENGQYFSPGTSPTEVAEAYDICEDLAQQCVHYCIRKMAEQSLPYEEVLEMLLQGLSKKNWVSPSQVRWIVQRTSQLLGWDTPP